MTLHHRQQQSLLSNSDTNNTDSYRSTDTEYNNSQADERVPETSHLSSTTETFFHIVCITAGTGILQLPYALKSGGWAGMAYIALAAAISAYTGKILVRCLYYKHGVRLQSYSEVAEAAFGPRGRLVVRTLKDVNLLGVVGIYIVLAGISIDSLVVGTPVEQFGERFWIAASAVVVWAAIVAARQIHDVFVLSIFGTLTTVVMVVIVIWLGVLDLEFMHVRPPTKAIDIRMMPISLASICFSFGGNLNWPDLEASMKSPKKWSKALSLATTFIAFIYACVAAVGYGVYGGHVRSPIFLSLPSGIAVSIAKAMITAHVLLACPILLTAVFIEAERDLNISSNTLGVFKERLWRAVFRSLLMLVIALFALFVSDFSKIVPILGAVAASLVVFVIPYDLSVSTYSPDGRVFQVEYAQKAVDNSGTAIGLRVKGGVVLAVEKIKHSRLLVPNSNKRIMTAGKHIGVASAGWMSDTRHLVKRTRDEAHNYHDIYKTNAPAKIIAERMGMYVQAYTLYSAVRPFGVSTILACIDEDGPQLYMIEPSGQYVGYRGCAAGKGKQAAKTEIEKLNLEELTVREAVKEAARIIYAAHDDAKDKLFELELSWICEESNNLHTHVPQDVLDEAIEHAEKALDDDDEMEDDEE
ncbi:putative proteasome subunit alpha type-7 [Coemansia erecta]|nr:putative proteasome subunit alpha type-7 [Coemansia erecta]